MVGIVEDGIRVEVSDLLRESLRTLMGSGAILNENRRLFLAISLDQLVELKVLRRDGLLIVNY